MVTSHRRKRQRDMFVLGRHTSFAQKTKKKKKRPKDAKGLDFFVLLRNSGIRAKVEVGDGLVGST